MTSMTAAQPPPDNPSLILTLRVLVPFACGYFLSYLYRTVNAVIAPDLVAGLGLDAAGLGLLTSVYFLSFGLFQLPLGLLLDRFGPRRTEAALLLVAATGAGWFALAEDLAALSIGRALIGLGVSACLMASFKAINSWFPAERLAAMNAWIMTAGGLGALAATAPVQAALTVTDWRGVLGALALATLAVAAVLLWVVPRDRAPTATGGLGELLGGLLDVYRSAFFWRVVPLTVTTQATFLSLQGLWAGPWLADVAGLQREAVANTLLLVAAAMVAGFFLLGQIASRLARLGLSLAVVMGACLLLYLLTQTLLALNFRALAVPLWLAFGFFGSAGILAFPLLAQHFPQQLIGRVNTAANVLVFLSAFSVQWLVGVIVNRWPAADGYQPIGYQVAFTVCVAVQAAAFIWYLPLTRRGVR